MMEMSLFVSESLGVLKFPLLEKDTRPDDIDMLAYYHSNNRRSNI